MNIRLGKFLIVLALVSSFAVVYLLGQEIGIPVGSSASSGNCLSVDTNKQVSWQPSAASSGIPTGTIILILSGTCPSGFAEASALDGYFLLGTLTANGDVGTTGGANTVTPTGTVSQPTLTMNLYTPAGTLSTTTVNASKGGGVTPLASVSFTGTQATLAGTVSQPTFTGNALDNRPAFKKVIFCQKQ